MPRLRRAAPRTMSDSTASPREAEKECNGCGVQLPLSDYAKNALGVGGVRAKCKQCTNEEDRVRYHRSRSETEAVSDDSVPDSKRQKLQETTPGSDLYVMALSTDPNGTNHGLKVGRSGNVAQRASALSESMPFSMVLLMTIPGAGHVERAVHGQLAPTRNTDGRAHEWFRTPLPNILHAVACALQSHTNVNGPASSATGAE
jgi:hypothetical protein